MCLYTFNYRNSHSNTSIIQTMWKQFFHEVLWNVTKQLHNQTDWHPLNITKHTLNYTKIIRNYTIEYFNNKKKFKSKSKTLNDVEFYMLKDKPDEVKQKFKEIYHKKPKFICINDDMDHTKDPSNETLNELHDFFYKYYPYPSPFEITDPNEYHPYYRKDEMVKQGYWKSNWNHDKGIFNDKIETKISREHNMFKSNKIQHMDHNYYKQKPRMTSIPNITQSNNTNTTNGHDSIILKIKSLSLNKYLTSTIITMLSIGLCVICMCYWILNQINTKKHGE